MKMAVGGEDNVLDGLTDRIHMLHDAIASDAAQPKTEDMEHAFENFFSSRVIRRMVIECPAFAVTLWRKALQGKCKIWAEGHRYYVLLLNMMPCRHVLDSRASKTLAFVACLCSYGFFNPFSIVDCELVTIHHIPHLHRLHAVIGSLPDSKLYFGRLAAVRR